MKRWSSHQALAIVFGLLLAVGTSVSAVQASDMALDLATSGCTDAMGSSCCDDCGGDDRDSNAGACLSICMNNACGVIPTEAALKAADQSAPSIPNLPESPSVTSPPDPFPPKLTDIS